MNVRSSLPAAALVTSSTLALTACDSPESFLGGSLLTFGILGLLALALIIYAVLDLIKSSRPMTEKVIWGVAIWVLPFIGAIAYLVVGKK